MKTAEEKLALLRQQVNAKIIWGAGEREVFEWLQERHGISGSEADDLLAGAYRAKRASVRSKALLYLVLSVPGMLLALAFVVFQSMGHFIIIGYGSGLILALGFASVGVFFRSLYRLLTGQAEGSVD